MGTVLHFRTIRVWEWATENGSVNDGRIPNVRAVRVHVSTGYNRVEGNRRASRNGRVSALPTRKPYRYESQLFRRCKPWHGRAQCR
jgi:hypothetical protein